MSWALSACVWWTKIIINFVSHMLYVTIIIIREHHESHVKKEKERKELLRG